MVLNLGDYLAIYWVMYLDSSKVMHWGSPMAAHWGANLEKYSESMKVLKLDSLKVPLMVED